MKTDELQLLRVSESKRFLTKEDGTPFFWLGDTAWELFHKLNREDADHYLKVRSQQGFNVVQAVALSEFDGIRTGNIYGRKPLLKNGEGIYDPSLPHVSSDPDDYDYWDHVDFIINKAAEYGLYIALLPTWGDKFNQMWGKGPVIFNGKNAYDYGLWLGNRYRDYNNIIWVLGGDRPLVTSRHFDVINAMAKGLKEGDGGRHIMTFHPVGGHSSSHHVHEEEWLDFNMIQSSHGKVNNENYKMVAEDYNKMPVKPTFDAEPCYEDHPIGFNAVNGYFDAADVRKAGYWSVFSGAMGHTYGHHCIWSMTTRVEAYFIMDWKTALLRPGAEQMGHIKSLMESKPFTDRIPDQSIIAENYEGANHLRAIRGNNYAFMYSPGGLNTKVHMGIISGDPVDAKWYNPRTGKYDSIGKFENKGTVDFLPPTAGRGEDWILVITDEDCPRH
ncbi:MAG TPA: glycoside hydrolase family 140 protein [Clostridia bacterium]|nr:glycoside hydrolase family 140 protein [Clostridia bacterium]